MSNKYVFNSPSIRNIDIVIDSADVDLALLHLQSIGHRDWQLQYVAESPEPGWLNRAFGKVDPSTDGGIMSLEEKDTPFEREHNPIWNTPPGGGMHFSGKIATITEPKFTNRQEVIVRLFAAMLTGPESAMTKVNPEWAAKTAIRLTDVLLKEMEY